MLHCIFQAQECEAIMPVCLASESTCIILAGDHLQMVERVYSKEAHALGFDRSLIERLDHLYTGQSEQFGGSPPIIRLRVNYRNNSEITEFLSSTFYSNHLISASNQQPVSDLPPMNFYAVYGCEVQDKDSTSFYNAAEVEELVRRVKDLYCCWPTDQWGVGDGEDILVTAAYSDQVTFTIDNIWYLFLIFHTMHCCDCSMNLWVLVGTEYAVAEDGETKQFYFIEFICNCLAYIIKTQLENTLKIHTLY